jgi:hypothetical protein
MTFRCPADSTVDEGQPRVRSYSMNSWIGSAEMEAEEEQTPFLFFFKGQGSCRRNAFRDLGHHG